MNLWWIDYLHASKYGSYLSALVLFGTVTGIDPWSLGASEKAAADLGISPGDAVACSKWRPINCSLRANRSRVFPACAPALRQAATAWRPRFAVPRRPDSRHSNCSA